MGDAHIWIRKEDEAKWAAIPDKPKFIHGALQLVGTEWWEKQLKDYNDQLAQGFGEIRDLGKPQEFTEVDARDFTKVNFDTKDLEITSSDTVHRFSVWKPDDLPDAWKPDPTVEPPEDSV